MTLPKIPPARSHVAVLWGEYFDEVMAITITSVLRRRGLRVTLVGLDGSSAVGRTGIIISVDRTLGQVAHHMTQTLCIVLPCDAAALLHAGNDPRFLDWMAAAAHQDCRIVLCQAIAADEDALQRLSIPSGRIHTVAATEDMAAFADRLASCLIADATQVTPGFASPDDA